MKRKRHYFRLDGSSILYTECVFAPLNIKVADYVLVHAKKRPQCRPEYGVWTFPWRSAQWEVAQSSPDLSTARLVEANIYCEARRLGSSIARAHAGREGRDNPERLAFRACSHWTATRIMCPHAAHQRVNIRILPRCKSPCHLSSGYSVNALAAMWTAACCRIRNRHGGENSSRLRSCSLLGSTKHSSSFSITYIPALECFERIIF